MSSTMRPGRPKRELPRVDERLVAPEARYEVEDGRLVYVVPADEPHGTRHSKLSALLEAHVGDDFEVASDMLTRLTEVDDVAPDASVFPRARDPQTGGRQVEQLAFEVVSSQSLNDAGRKAKKLTGRGVRRVFAIDAERRRAFEWSAELGTWSLLDPSSEVEDPALSAPLPVLALSASAKVDDAVARALLARQNPVLGAALEEVRFRGRAEGKAEALIAVLVARGMVATPQERERVLRADDDTLDRWLARAVECESIASLLG